MNAFAPPSRPVALVTGGGSGIGRAVAALLVSAGFRTVVTGRNKWRLKQTCATVPGKWDHFAADLNDPAAPERIARYLAKCYGRLDVLVNNAAIAELGPMRTFSAESVHRHVWLNLGAVLSLTGALVDLLAVPGIAHVVNVSSEQSLAPRAGRAVYGATKAGINYATRALAAELAAAGIRVNALLPGAVDTPMLRAATGGVAVGTPLGSGLLPEEVAEWVLYLIRAPHVTGALITVDGGTSLTELACH